MKTYLYTIKTHLQTTLLTFLLCSLLSLTGTALIFAETLTQSISATYNGALTSPFSLPAGTAFTLVFNSLFIEGHIAIKGTDWSERFSSEQGTIDSGPYQVTLQPGEYTLTETYAGSVSSSNSLVGNPSLEISTITFERPLSVKAPSIYTITIHTTLNHLNPYLEGPFTLSGDTDSGVVGDTLVLNLVAVEEVKKDELIQYVSGFVATVTSDTTLIGKPAGAPATEAGGDDKPTEETSENKVDEEKPEADVENAVEEKKSKDEADTEGKIEAEKSEDENESKGKGPKGKPEEKSNGKGNLSDKGNGKSKDKDKASVTHETEGTLDIGPMSLTIELPAISDEPIHITARLTGDWTGKGTRVVTPSGVENQHIQVETFLGTMEVSHAVDGLPSPLVVDIEAEDGSVKEHIQPEAPADLFLRAKRIVVRDPLTGEEIPWPEELLGPMPNRVKIKDGTLQFIKSEGTPEGLVEEVAEEAVKAAEEAEFHATEAEQQPVSVAQQLARNAAEAAKRAAKKAEDAAREAQRAAEQAHGEASRLSAEKARKSAESAKGAAKKAEQAAKKAGKAATDLNDDGKNDVFDLVLVARAFGTQVSLEIETAVSDINGDGVVNLFDLILVAQGLADGTLILGGETTVPAAPGGTVMPHPNPAFHLQPEPLDASDNTFRVALVAEGIQPLYAFQLEMVYDEAVLEVVEVTEGDLLASDGALTFWDSAGSSGNMVTAIATRIASEAISGPGVLASVTVKVNAERLATRDFASLDQQTQRSILSGTLTVSDAMGRIVESPLRVKGFEAHTAEVPSRPELFQNYPNPFNPETWMPYQLKEAADVSIRIYDAKGSFVRALHLGHRAPGFYRSRDRAAYWDGRNDAGEQVASGLYFYQLQAGHFSATRRMVILK